MNRIKTLPSLFKLPAVTLGNFLKILKILLILSNIFRSP
jgi:hypothetical protein